MHNEPGIGFGLGRIDMVIVNAMSIERQRGIAEQQHRIRCKARSERGGIGRCGRVLDRARRGDLTIDDRLLLPDTKLVAAQMLMFNANKDQYTTAALLGRYIPDYRAAGEGFADLQRGDMYNIAAGPHVGGKRDRWQKPAPHGMAIL